MNAATRKGIRAAVVGSLLLLAVPAGAQEKAKATPPPAPPMPTPGPAHEILKSEAGVWDATVEASMGPQAPPSVSKGVETNTLLGDGLWLVTDFKSEMMGQPFAGHGVSGYDPHKKKYVATWVDSMSTGLGITESTYDAATKTMTGWFEGPDETGKITRMKMVTAFKDTDTRVFTMSMTGPDGKEFQTLKITYKRRK